MYFSSSFMVCIYTAILVSRQQICARTRYGYPAAVVTVMTSFRICGFSCRNIIKTCKTTSLSFICSVVVFTSNRSFYPTSQSVRAIHPLSILILKCGRIPREDIKQNRERIITSEAPQAGETWFEGFRGLESYGPTGREIAGFDIYWIMNSGLFCNVLVLLIMWYTNTLYELCVCYFSNSEIQILSVYRFWGRTLKTIPGALFCMAFNMEY